MMTFWDDAFRNERWATQRFAIFHINSLINGETIKFDLIVSANSCVPSINLIGKIAHHSNFHSVLKTWWVELNFRHKRLSIEQFQIIYRTWIYDMHMSKIQIHQIKSEIWISNNASLSSRIVLLERKLMNNKSSSFRLFIFTIRIHNNE